MNVEDLLKTISDKFQYLSSERFEQYLSIENFIDNVINYYEGIINCLPSNVYWLDKNGVAIGCNKNVLDMFGFTSFKQFRGLSFEEMGKAGHWSHQATEKFKNDTLQVTRTGKPILNTKEPPIPHSNGKLIYFLTSRVPLFDKNGKLIGIVGISVDISETKQIDQALYSAKIETKSVHQIDTQDNTDNLEPHFSFVETSQKIFNILLVEDNAIARQTAQMLLQNSECKIHVAENAEIALQLIKTESFDLIITDLGLPGLQGDEMISIFRYWEKKSVKNPIPVFGLTAHADNKIINDCLIAGIDQVFLKPLDEKLLNIIQEYKNSYKIINGTTETKLTCQINSSQKNILSSDEDTFFHLEKYPLFDESEGILKTGKKELLIDLIKISSNTLLIEELNNLKTAYDTQNWQMIQKIAHKLKGGALYCGTTRMIYACQFIENYLESKEHHLSEKQYKHLISIIRATHQSIKAWLETNNK
jgi:PAS domain S-box-containing protein